MNSLELLRERVPFRTFATSDLEKGVYKKLKDKALTDKYIQIQLSDKLIHSLVFDLDFAGAAFAAHDANLAEPSIIAVNKKNGHAHLTYLLSAPVSASKLSRAAPLAYLNAIKAAYALRLNADINYAGLINKNPLHAHWRTIITNKTYDLSELAEYVDLSIHSKKTIDINNLNSSRNCTIFNVVRKNAYKQVNKFTSIKDFSNYVSNECYQLNKSYTDALSNKEVADIAKSIAIYTYKNKAKIGRDSVSNIVIDKVNTAILTLKITRHDLANLSNQFILKHFKNDLAEIANLSKQSINRVSKKSVTK